MFLSLFLFFACGEQAKECEPCPKCPSADAGDVKKKQRQSPMQQVQVYQKKNVPYSSPIWMISEKEYDHSMKKGSEYAKVWIEHVLSF